MNEYNVNNSDSLKGNDGINSGGTCPLPLISVHVFCITDTLYSVVERSKIDDRRNFVNMQITKGSIAEAASFFCHNPTPNIIIVQIQVNPREVLSALEPLADVCDPDTKVIIVGDTNDIMLYRDLIANGVSEYLIEPLSVSDIIKSISDVSTSTTIQKESRETEKEKAPKLCCSISFIGSRGGVGSSTIAHNCAFSIASVLAMENILADLDFPYGTVNINFDQDPMDSIISAISSQRQIDKAFISQLLICYVENLSILTAPTMLDCTYDFDEKRLCQSLIYCRRCLH
ncbi:AAA family ATPase [Candidatus Liberibacter africanus]|uniref:AAA family ATPase n=1 Tax=Liberibacter africanus TaxID=34020 RepID=UPI001FD59B75|nr:hypothetical protein [Candidatus Liberibacter africanus]